MNKLTQSVLALPVVLLAACAAGPDYHQPAAPAIGHFARAEANGTQAAPMANAEFWQAFRDTQLTRLVERALSTNNDLRVALARYDSETALLREARSDHYPTVTMNANTGHQKLSVDQAYGFQRSNDVHSASVNAGWELDVFGKVRRDVEAHRAETAALAEDLKALQVIIVGQVASAYMDLRGTQARLRVARESIDKQRETLRIISARMEAGRSADFDVARARAQFESATSRVFALEARIAVDEHRLAVLTGRPPEALIAELDVPAALPALPPAVDPETPAIVLRRRPDIAAAEQRLHAATARIGVASADLFPHVRLSGMLGTFAFRSGDLFTKERETSLLGLDVDWSFLDAGRVRARIAASDAAAAGLLSAYQQTVLLALEDTENALIRYARTRSEDEHLEQAAAAGSHAVQIAREQLRAGTIGVYEVLDAEREQLRAQDAFAEGRTRSAVAAVALFKELAGGWPQQMSASASVSAGIR
ncbi:efflux transporter outer membrane subunit [Massilia luteola]|uniref:efflux transporter outer membrane subunit n=1 Tax=Massilia luteola TaxID=3081751 RepID=UPI002ACBF652|nr:efflux transporter outer membrane subunit [Massilia sp. Gc5]